MYMENVTEILHEAAATAILPRYQALAAGEITEKSPANWSPWPTGRRSS